MWDLFLLFKIAFTKVHYTHQSTLDAVLCHQMEMVGMLSDRQRRQLFKLPSRVVKVIESSKYLWSKPIGEALSETMLNAHHKSHEEGV